MPDWSDRSYPARVGLSVDCTCNAVLGGVPDETVSHRVARLQAAGNRWGCVFCRVLGVLVERDHCGKTLDPTATEAPGAMIRAGLALLLSISLAIWLIEHAPGFFFRAVFA